MGYWLAVGGGVLRAAWSCVAGVAVKRVRGISKEK